MDTDFVQTPRQFSHQMEGVTVHFGCLVSKEVFHDLYKIRNVYVEFRFEPRKLIFYVSESGSSYKLKLSYENIGRVQLDSLSALPPHFLVIQLTGAPRICKKVETRFVRTTDFTKSSSIGQASHLCLEVLRKELPTLFFPYFELTERSFKLVPGRPFSQNLDLVPIVGPTKGSRIPFDIVFKISALVQHGRVPGPVLDASFFDLLDPNKQDVAAIEYVLEKLKSLNECCYDPVSWITEEYRNEKRLMSPTISLDDGLVYVRRVQITPSKVYFCGPEVSVSNRVLRHYAEYIDNFLLVSFLDEELEKLYSTELSSRVISLNGDTGTAIYKRILKVLRDGIVISDKKFEFLAFSSSQLRDHSLWMFASTEKVNAAVIRDWMGDFSRIKNVAEYGARIGQSFGSSHESLSVDCDEIEWSEEVENERFGTHYVFSDGCGMISEYFAKKVANKCGYDYIPSAFQIQYGGYKGVVAINPTSYKDISLRPSMCKFESAYTKLDILNISKYQPCYLNRQLITLLSTLGIQDYVFEKKQKEAVDLLDVVLRDPLKAQEALDLMSPGENTNILKEMLSCGYNPNSEPFLSMMLQVFRATQLFELRTNTRIYIPQGRLMMGCLDETGILDYGEVFVQFSSAGFGSKNCEIVDGKVVVAKNPCLHPGDVRILNAINNDLTCVLDHMVDCIVFPQRGPRPHQNECSGGDLDGDTYFVCWDPDLIPPKQIEPMDYNPAPSTQLDHDVTIEDVEEFFTDFIVNDNVGIISNAHTVFADREPEKAMSDKCVELAKLFSIAVDFPKTGVPAVIPEHLRVKEYPDFMEKPYKPTYESQNVIGKLFRQVKDIAPIDTPVNPFTREVAEQTYDRDMEVDGFMDYVDDAFEFKTDYDFKLGNLMDLYGIKTEAELLGGSILKMSNGEAVSFAVKSLRKEARSWFQRGRGDHVDVMDDFVFAKASAWYHVTYHPDYWGRYNEDMPRGHFLSFAWCIHDKLVEIKKRKAARN